MENNHKGISIQPGIPENLLEDAAKLYYVERIKSLREMTIDDQTANALVSHLNPDYAISAISADGALIGFAAIADYRQGFWRTGRGASPKGANLWSRLKETFSYGETPIGFRWHASQADTLLLDSICVVEGAQSDGIGERLLESVIAEARARSMARVEVVVPEPNPHVKAVYERYGFNNRNPRSGYYVAQPGFRPFAQMVLDLG